MATTFRVFCGGADASEARAQRATEAMAEVEAAGGAFLESHWSTAGYSGGVLATLVIVYDDGSGDASTESYP